MPSLRPLLVTLLLSSCVAFAVNAQTPEAKTDAVVNCPVLLEPDPPPYGLAKAVLVSLWKAKNAAEHGKEMTEEATKADNEFSMLTGTMRAAKLSTNDFICARKPLKPFVTKDNSEEVRLTATALLIAYDQHIDINNRLLQLLKKMDSIKQTELMDQISTLQVERGQRWSDLVQPTSLALMLLVDADRPDEKGGTSWLKITNAQKQSLLGWANEHFPEFNNGTPKDQWLDPAKTAELFLVLLNGHRGSDQTPPG